MMKKRIKKGPSLAVIRAVTRLNDHAHKKASRSVIWTGESMTKHLPITSQ
ncbi:MAG: hypothetical protein VX630_06415 [Candidatus Neomarinimicrobiota bacterium]|nr:hypothetical protein [Candidatus Neomarinimicrobiota bacterium]